VQFAVNVINSEITMSVINTNVSALYSQNALNVNARNMQNAMQQLSTGQRINSAADDAAGLAVSQTMTAQIRGLNQAVRNANDGVSMLQTAEGALVETTNMLQRMRELAVQSANDTLGSSDKTSIDTEFQALHDEISRISANTKWNGISVLTGSFTGLSSTSGTFSFQVGYQGSTNGGSNQIISVKIDNMNWGGSNFSSTSTFDITTGSAARTAIDTIDTAIANVATQRSKIGATVNRLTYAVDNLNNISQNMVQSRSRIVDADYATATTALSRSQIIQQAATAMLAQANQQPQSVLALLK